MNVLKWIACSILAVLLLGVLAASSAIATFLGFVIVAVGAVGFVAYCLKEYLDNRSK